MGDYIKGGQGRSSESIESDASVLAMILAGAVALAIWAVVWWALS
jgi:hypothetical protein